MTKRNREIEQKQKHQISTTEKNQNETILSKAPNQWGFSFKMKMNEVEPHSLTMID